MLLPHRESTTPGTVTKSIPDRGISVTPLVLRCSIVSAFGAHPLAFKPYSLLVLASQLCCGVWSVIQGELAL